MLRAFGRASLVPSFLGAVLILGSGHLLADVPDAVLTLEASTPFASGQTGATPLRASSCSRTARCSWAARRKCSRDAWRRRR